MSSPRRPAGGVARSVTTAPRLAVAVAVMLAFDMALSWVIPFSGIPRFLGVAPETLLAMLLDETVPCLVCMVFLLAWLSRFLYGTRGAYAFWRASVARCDTWQLAAAACILLYCFLFQAAIHWQVYRVFVAPPFALLLAETLPLAAMREEFVNRGFILRSLRKRMPPWSAIVTSAFLFLFLHLRVFAGYGANIVHSSAPFAVHKAIYEVGFWAVYVFGFGIISGYLCEKGRGSLYGCILAHIGFVSAAWFPAPPGWPMGPHDAGWQWWCDHQHVVWKVGALLGSIAVLILFYGLPRRSPKHGKSGPMFDHSERAYRRLRTRPSEGRWTKR